MMPHAPGRLMPIVTLDGKEFLLALELMRSLPLAAIKERLGSIASFRDDITRALDWLFTGV